MSNPQPIRNERRKSGAEHRKGKTAPAGPANQANPGSRSTPAQKARQTASAIAIELEHARWRHLGWTAFGVIAGGLILLNLGVVGQALGALLLLMAVIHGYHFARTLMYPAGAIDINPERAVLPLGLCRAAPKTVPFADIKHAYFLRRAVPWHQTGPLLVVETTQHAYVYPRDWFASEDDQQRVVRTIRHGLGQEQP